MPYKNSSLISFGNVAEAGRGLFSPEEMRRLMQAEFYRSRRYGYPLVSMLMQVDRLGALQDLYGYDSKREIQRSAAQLFASTTRESDLACFVGERLLAVFPHSDATAGALLGWRLLERARELRFDSEGRTIKITLSVGGSDNQAEGVQTFEDMERAAGEGLRLALEAGGDRYVVREEVEQEIVRLRSRLQALGEPGTSGEETAPSASSPGTVSGSRPERIAPPPLEGESEEAFVERLRDAFRKVTRQRTPELTVLEERIVNLALEEMREDRSGNGEGAEASDHVKRLERRIAKLDSLLGKTSEELERARREGAEAGLSSVFREVQGLADGESELERKRMLMRRIFEANLDLQRRKHPPA